MNERWSALPSATLPLLQHPPRMLSFTGEGGVGRMSLACAWTLSFADAGKRVLLVGTEPAANLDELLGAERSD